MPKIIHGIELKLLNYIGKCFLSVYDVKLFLCYVLGSNSLICMLVGTVLNKHAHNFAEFFHARNGSTFAGYADIKDHNEKFNPIYRRIIE